MRFVDVDFDDAGRGPFVLDIVRYLIASKSIGGQIKKRPLEKIYLAGIAGKELDPPKEVRSLLAMPVSDYDDMVAQYAEKKSSKYGFVFKKGEIEPYNAKIARSDNRTPVSRCESHRSGNPARRTWRECRSAAHLGSGRRSEIPAHRGVKAVRRTGNR